MLIDKELIVEAKEKLNEQAAIIIRDDLQIENWDEKNLKGSCPFHEGDKTPSFIWNSKNNSFHCFGCNTNYGILDHYMVFHHLTFLDAVEKLFDQVGTKYKFGEKGVKTLKEYHYPTREDSDRSQAEEYLAFRKISATTMDAFDVQADSHGNIAFHFYDLNDVLKLVKYRPSKKLSKGESKTWCQKDADTAPLLFNMNRIDPSKPLVITEGEIDAMSVYESGFHNVVSVPLGAGNVKWIEENYDWLEQFGKIIIWADSDEAGIKLRKEACSRLGVWRTLFVEIPKEMSEGMKAIKDANAVLIKCGKQAVLDLIAEAQEMPVIGVDDLSTVDDFDLENSPGLYSGLEPIDNTIYKFLFGSVVLLTGVKGSGKSTFLNQTFICEALNQRQDVFTFSGELSAPVLKTWLELTMAGREKIKMKNDFIHIIDPDAKQAMREWYKGRVWVYNQTDNRSDAVLDRAITITRKYGAKIWILDNLMTLDIGETDGNVLQKQKEFIVKLVVLAKTYNVLIVLVGHPRKVMANARLTSDDIAGSGNLGNMVQYILSVRRFSESEKKGEKDTRTGKYKKGKEPIEHDVEAEILKNRYTGKIGTARLFFDYPSYRFYSKPSELWKRYSWNEDESPLPKNDPNQHTESPYDDEDYED